MTECTFIISSRQIHWWINHIKKRQHEIRRKKLTIDCVLHGIYVDFCPISTLHLVRVSMTMIVCVFKCYIRVKIAQVPTNERGKKRLLNNQIIISKHAHEMCRCTLVKWTNKQKYMYIHNNNSPKIDATVVWLHCAMVSSEPIFYTLIRRLLLLGFHPFGPHATQYDFLSDVIFWIQSSKEQF